MDAREQAAKLRAEGMSLRSIARTLGVGHATVNRWTSPAMDQRHRERARQKQATQATRMIHLEDQNRMLTDQLRVANAELEHLRRKPTITSFTDAQAYWLATVSPEEFERIARGLAEWEYYELEEAA